jgi:hypothetical protein
MPSPTPRFPASLSHSANGDMLATWTALHQRGRRQSCLVAAATRSANQGRNLNVAPDRSIAIGVRRWTVIDHGNYGSELVILAIFSFLVLELRNDTRRPCTVVQD